MSFVKFTDFSKVCKIRQSRSVAPFQYIEKQLKSITQTVYHTIKLKPDAVPVKQKQRRIPINYQQEFDQMIDDMLESGKISPTFTSPWSSPPRLLRKKDGSVRMTIDYQYLNSCTEKIAYPFPFVDDIFARLSKAKYFTVIDLILGYFHLKKFNSFLIF